MGYIGQQLPADVFSGFTIDKFTGDGTANKALTLSEAPFNETAVLVTIDGVVQEPTDDFTVSGTTLTLVGTAANGSEINVTHLSGPVPVTQAASLDLNGASDKLILDSDADTTISADTDDQIDFKLGGVDEMTMSSSGIVINESSNDRDVRIETNASTHGLFVDGGNDSVLINKSAPSANYNHAESLVPGFEMFGTSNTDHRLSAFTYGSADAGGHIMMFGKQRDATADSYTVVQADDQLGQIFFQGADGTHFINGAALRVFVESGVGANDMPANLRFYTNGGTTSTTERMRLTGGGYFKASPDTDYYSVSSSFGEFNNSVTNEQVLTLTHHGSSLNPYGLFIKFNDTAPDNATQWFIACHDNAASRFQVMSDGDIQTHDANINSDSSLKENIVDATSKWDDVKALKVRNFNWIKDYHPNRQHKHIGFIAQEFETVFPNLVRENNIAADLKYTESHIFYQEDDDEVIKGTKKAGDVKLSGKQVGETVDPVMKKSIKQSALIPILTKTLQEAMAKIETLETKVKALEDA